MKNDTQKKWVLDQIKEKGFITRNECLKVYISRLGAIICDLQKDGYKFTAEYQKTPYGQDYVYTLTGQSIQQALFNLTQTQPL